MSGTPAYAIASEHPVFAGRTYASVQKTAQKLREIRGPNGGVRLSRQGPVLVSSPQELLRAETYFYYVRGQSWSPSPEISLNYFPFRTDHPEGAIVPITGGIFIGKRKLSDQELETVGLTPVKDE